MAAKAAKQPANIVKSWLAGMQSAVAQQKYKDSINALQVNPMALAASPDAEAKYINAVQLSVTSGRRAAALNAVPLDRYKTNAMNNASQLGVGANRAQAKMLDRMTKWAPIYAQASQAAASAVGPMEKVRAALNTLLTAAGKPNV